MHFELRISDFGFSTHPPGLFSAKTQRRKDARSTRPPEEPQRHRDTEFAQRCFLNSPQPRRHEDTKESQSPPSHPVETADHADRRRWGHATFLCAARSGASEYRNHHSTSFNETPWPLDDGHGTTGPGNRFESKLSCRFPDPVVCALEERRPRHLSSSFNGWKAHTPHYNNTEERQNRRAPGTSAGEKRCDDKRSRSEFASFSPATGDPQSPVVLPPINGTVFQAQHLPLCVCRCVVGLRVFVSSWLRRGRASGSAFICVICGFSKRVGGSVSSVSLWLFDHRIPRIV